MRVARWHARTVQSHAGDGVEQSHDGDGDTPSPSHDGDERLEWHENSEHASGMNWQWSEQARMKHEQHRQPHQQVDNMQATLATTALRGRAQLHDLMNKANGGAGYSIPVIHNPSPLDFYVNFVSKGLPCIITGLTDDWPCRTQREWTLDYLKETMGDGSVSVDVTPDGVCDRVMEEYLVRAQRRQMPFSQFIDQLKNKQPADEGHVANERHGRDEGESTDPSGVMYIQQQQNNFPLEFSPLQADIASSLPLAEGTLTLTATNFWMGDDRCVSSLHFDLYENIMCVIAGKKDWLLYPPSELPFLYLNTFQEAEWVPAGDADVEGVEDDFVVGIYDTESTVPWVGVDLEATYDKEFSRFSNAMGLRVTVGEGDAVFVPATWFHQVSQRADDEGKAIAVNYWYETHNPMVDNFQVLLAQTDAMVRRVEAGGYPPPVAKPPLP